MRISTLLICLTWGVFWFTVGYGVTSSLGADTDLTVRAGIWNLDHEPISSLALSECARHGFPCVVQCRDAPVGDIITACVKYELCCGRAGPYLDTPFGETVPVEDGVYE